MEELEIRDDGKVIFEMTPEESKRLRAFLDRKASGVQKPRVYRKGNQIIMDTGLDDGCIFNKGTPQEIHAFRIYQRAGSHDIDEAGRAVNPVASITIVETVSGDYVYMDSKPVCKKSDLEIIPQQHLRKAIDWYDAKYGRADEETEKEPIPTPVSEPDEEIELALKDKVIILATKGLSGKQIAEKLKCNEGTVSVHKKNAIKAKLLSRDGKKFTPLGLEKYGQMSL